MQTFLVKHHRNSESRMFDKKFLDRIGEFRRFPGIFPHACVARHAARVAGAANLSHAVTFFKGGFGFLEIECGRDGGLTGRDSQSFAGCRRPKFCRRRSAALKGAKIQAMFQPSQHDVRRFFADYYHGEAMVVSVAGPLEHDEL